MTQARQYFGTDGIRGRANEHPMTADFALRLAYATAAVLGKDAKVVIGKDTRLSGYMLEQAMTAGFVAAGVDVFLLGPLPTPAVAHLTQKLGADFGVMISASHNPYEDNGIKLIGPDGYKLSDETERAIESALDGEPHRASGDALGKAARVDNALAQYEQYLSKDMAANASLQGLTIVIDAANGAGYKVAPDMFQKIGATVIPIHTAPDGVNINYECGATHTESLRAAVLEHKAHLGVALDGDADRVILIDELGDTIDGDQMLAVLSEDLPQGAPVITTLMANLGLERYLASQNRAMVRTPVGDRYVVEAMREQDAMLGGEQSGHIIFGGATCGDGLRTALHMALHLKSEGGPASATLRRFKPLPQILQNVRAPKTLMPLLTGLIHNAETKLGDAGRVLVRASGTEPLIRVMAEGDDEEAVKTIVHELCAEIEILAADQKVA